ncbi:response regulator transcription factor [Isoptericola sp. NPDC019693]|uniref:response regulator n=1 Tax=Isoptericola sp. NPDC019693 TaxID=3364009 RepID=UPI0037927E73
METRVVIVDDSAVYVAAAQALLEREGMRVVGSAGGGGEAVDLCDRLRPDVVLVDVALGDESGFDVVHRLARAGGPTLVLISTRSADEIDDLLDSSPAAGFVTKAAVSADAIRAIMRPGG